ncbi:MAG: ABC transporter permease [Bacteroidota bacterium]
MTHYNIKFIIRNILRNKSLFTINILGLSIGIACALFIYLWVLDEYQVDKFLSNDNGPYELIMHFHSNKDISTGFSTPCLLAENLNSEIPEIKYAAAVRRWNNITINYGQSPLKASGIFAGKQFFQIFDYKLIYGNSKMLLNDKSSIVISDVLAKKLFNNIGEGLIGKEIQLQQNNLFKISGVFQSPPKNATHQFDFVVPFEEFKSNNNWAFNWNYSTVSTYVSLKNGVELQLFNDKIKKYLNNKRDKDQLLTTLEARKFTDAYLYGEYDNGQVSGGRILYIRLFILAAIFILIIACMNFMNLSTAIGAERAKEVSIKKIIGESDGNLIIQFLNESIAISIIALILALVIVVDLLPFFNDLTGKEIKWSFNANTLGMALLVTLFTGLLAGSYPAFMLSRFKPKDILKGVSSLSSKDLSISKAI